MKYGNKRFNEVISNAEIAAKNDVVTDRNLGVTRENHGTEIDVVAENIGIEKDVVAENIGIEKDVTTENYESEEDVVAEKKALEKKLKRKKSTLKSQAKRYIIDFCRGNDFQELFDWIQEGLINYEKSKAEYLADTRRETEKNYDVCRDVEVEMCIKLNAVNNGERWIERRCSDES